MTDTSPPDLTERQQFWLNHLLACEAEGKTTIAYAREHDLSPSGMHSARLDLVNKGALPAPGKSRFVRAKVAVPASNTQWQVQLPNGATVGFCGTVQHDTLLTVLKAASVV